MKFRKRDFAPLKLPITMELRPLLGSRFVALLFTMAGGCAVF